jgi:hypothetical protein
MTLFGCIARMDGQTDHYRAAATKRRDPKYFQIMIYIGMLNTLQGMCVDHLTMMCGVPCLVTFDFELWPQGQIIAFLITGLSQITNHGTRHIVLMWSTHMPNIKSLSHETKTLQPGQDLLRTEARMDGQTDHYRAAATKRRAPKYFQIMIYIGMLNTHI